MLLNCGVGEDSWESLGTARGSSQSILKEISPGCSLEGLMLKLKLQYFGHLMQRADSFEKNQMLGKIEGRRRGRQRMRWLDGITDLMTWVWVDSGVSDGQGGLTLCDSWGHKELDMTEWLSWTELSHFGDSHDKKGTRAVWSWEYDIKGMKLLQMTWHFLSGETRAPISKCLLYECSIRGWVSVVVLTCFIFKNIGDAVRLPCLQFS